MTENFGTLAEIDQVLNDSSLWIIVGLGNNPERAAGASWSNSGSSTLPQPSEW